MSDSRLPILYILAEEKLAELKERLSSAKIDKTTLLEKQGMKLYDPTEDENLIILFNQIRGGTRVVGGVRIQEGISLGAGEEDQLLNLMSEKNGLVVNIAEEEVYRELLGVIAEIVESAQAETSRESRV